MENIYIKENTFVKYKYYLLILIIYTFVFQNYLQERISFFQYIDELYCLIFIPLAILYFIRNAGVIKLKDLIIIICFLLILFVGTISYDKYSYQSLTYAIYDVVSISKPFFAFFVPLLLFYNLPLKIYGRKISLHCYVIGCGLFILTIFDYIYNIFPGTYRYGIKSIQLFYSHPTYYAAINIFLLALVILTDNKFTKKLPTYLIIINILTTFRMKAIGLLITVFILYWYIFIRQKKIRITQILILGAGILLVSYDTILHYFIRSTDSARSALLFTSFSIGKDYFPIGTGFATFGSYMSGVNYSPVYSMYGIQNVYGLTIDNYDFIADSFWPMILGQFGAIGLICFVLFIVNIFKQIQRIKIQNLPAYMAAMVAFCYLLIASTSEASYTNPIVIPFMLVISLALVNG